MKIAIYPGSFDPVTYGHLDILSRANKVFDQVIIAVLKNTNKKSFFSTEERIKLLEENIDNCGNIKVKSFEGLTIEFAKANNANVIIRGLRAVSDFEYEMQLSQMNQALCSDIHTVFLTTKPKYNFVASSIIKEIFMMGGDISQFVPHNVVSYLNKKYNKRGNE